MSINRFIFLFDYKNFGKAITPALAELRHGTPNDLQQLANDTTREHPEIWNILKNLYYPSIVDEQWDYSANPEGTVGFWITVLICRYSLELDNNVERSDPAFTGVLSKLGIDRNLVEALLWGNPLSGLLTQLANWNDKPSKNLFEDLPFSIGWLSTEEIERIKTELQLYQEQNNYPAFENCLNILNKAIVAQTGLALGVVM